VGLQTASSKFPIRKGEKFCAVQDAAALPWVLLDRCYRRTYKTENKGVLLRTVPKTPPAIAAILW
jgi:hypothetical protein